MLSTKRCSNETTLAAVLWAAICIAGGVLLASCAVVPKVVEPTAPPVERSVLVAGGRIITEAQRERYNALIDAGYGTPKYHILPALKKDAGIRPELGPVAGDDPSDLVLRQAPTGRYFLDEQHCRYFEEMALEFNSSIKR